MGRYYHNKKSESDGMLKIDMAFLRKSGCLEPGAVCKTGGLTWTSSFGTKNSVSYYMMLEDKVFRLVYSKTKDDGSKKEFDYKIQLTTTPCNYGGQRYWFICPLVKDGEVCGRRVRVLYKGGDYFGCRHCYNLSYESRKVGGFQKQFGRIISYPELEKMESQIKRRYYKGQMTKKYKRFLYLQERNEEGFIQGLAKISKRLGS